jgi:hypothetical protein
MQAVSAMIVELVGGSQGHPIPHLLLSHSCFTMLTLCLADTRCFLL